MSRPPCNCRHIGNCPFQPDPLDMTDMDGNVLYRALTEAEERTSQVQAVGGQRLHGSAIGDFVRTTGQGDIQVIAKALDPELAVAYAKTKVGKACKADSYMWKKRHPVPTA